MIVFVLVAFDVHGDESIINVYESKLDAAAAGKDIEAKDLEISFTAIYPMELIKNRGGLRVVKNEKES